MKTVFSYFCFYFLLGLNSEIDWAYFFITFTSIYCEEQMTLILTLLQSCWFKETNLIICNNFYALNKN